MLRYRSAWQSNGIPSKAVRPTRNLWANESKKKNRFSFCRVPQKISLAESFAFTRLVVIPNEYEESPAFYRLIFFTPLMLHSEWHTAKSCNILREILQGKAFQNDITVISNACARSHTKHTIWQEILRSVAPKNDRGIIQNRRKNKSTIENDRPIPRRKKRKSMYTESYGKVFFTCDKRTTKEYELYQDWYSSYSFYGTAF